MEGKFKTQLDDDELMELYNKNLSSLFPEPDDCLRHPFDMDKYRRANAGKLYIDPGLHFGFPPESKGHPRPVHEELEEEFEDEESEEEYDEGQYDDSLEDRKSSSFIPYVFPSPRSSYQPSFNEMDDAMDEGHNNLGMPSERQKEDVVFKVLRPLDYGTSFDGKGPGPWRAFSATIIRYPFASGGTEPVVEKVEICNPAKDFFVETTVAASGTKEDVGVPLAQMSEESPLKRCKSLDGNLSRESK